MFVEMDWVPSAMHQAEDRGHRAGQTAAGYHIITIAAQMDGLNLDTHVRAVLNEKLVTINSVLNESAELIGDRIETGEVPVMTRVINAMLSSEQKAIAEKNASNKAAAKIKPAKVALPRSLP